MNHAIAVVYKLWPDGVRQVPASVPEPPYDDRVGRGPRPAVSLAMTFQGTLALSFAAQGAPVPRKRPRLRLVPPPGEDPRPQAATCPAEEPRRYAGEPPGLPAVDPWARRLGQAVVETLTGERAADQLVPWTTERVHQAISRRAAGPFRWRPLQPGRIRPRVRSVRVSRPSLPVAEVTVIAHDGSRPRALALRLEIRGNRWLCTAVEFGR